MKSGESRDLVPKLGPVPLVLMVVLMLDSLVQVLLGL
jgi:hypothetical protein